MNNNNYNKKNFGGKKILKIKIIHEIIIFKLKYFSKSLKYPQKHFFRNKNIILRKNQLLS